MKKENKLQDIVSWIGDSVHDVISHEFDESVRDVSFKTIHQYEDYGDTSIDVAQYIGDDEEVEFRENWERDTTVDAMINLLKEDKYFRDCIQDMIEYIAWNRTLEV